MQPALLSHLTVDCDSIAEIEPAISFECLVEGKKLLANITHVEDNGEQFIYRISFSDGYVASFVAPMQGGKWQDKNLASPYAKAIADDLNAFCGFLPSRPPLCLRLKGEKESFNVWVVPFVFKADHYSVFYKGDYHFDVRRTGVWEASSVRTDAIINREIASIVCKNLGKQVLQPELF